jgi:MFS transporter, DHA3 family, multidrug efflux protein
VIGAWFGTGPERGLALVFVLTGIVGLLATVLALRSGPYRRLSRRYVAGPAADSTGGERRSWHTTGA